MSAQSPAYLADHQVQGSVVTPAAAYIEQGLAAAAEVFGPGRHGLANLAIQQAMFLPEGVRRRVQVSIAPNRAASRRSRRIAGRRTRTLGGGLDDACAGMLVHESTSQNEPTRVQVNDKAPSPRPLPEGGAGGLECGRLSGRFRFCRAMNFMT